MDLYNKLFDELKLSQPSDPLDPNMDNSDIIDNKETSGCESYGLEENSTSKGNRVNFSLYSNLLNDHICVTNLGPELGKVHKSIKNLISTRKISKKVRKRKKKKKALAMKFSKLKL